VLNRLKQALQAFKNEAQPKTYIASGGSNRRNYFSERMRNQENLKKYRTIYEQGGVFAEAIDTYALFAFANGWRLEGEDENLADDVWQWLEGFDFDYVMEQGLIDALVYGDGFQENVFTRGGDLERIVARESWSFSILHDDHGKINGYMQQIDMLDQGIELKPEQATHIQLKSLGGSMYGLSLIGRAYDDIMRDTKTAEASATAVERHGFKKYHIRVGKEGEIIPQDVLQNIDKQFQDLESKNDFVTVRDVEIKNIDEGGLTGIDTYNDISIMRACAALGVPEELLGLRRGSTDATAAKRIESYLQKIARYQKRLERIYSNVINLYTQEPGAVRLVFNDITPEDEKLKAEWIANIMRSTPIDPFSVLPRRWVQEQLNIDPGQYEDDEEEDLFPEQMPGDITDAPQH